MVVNDKGEEVNEDGTPITDEQKETHDWTDVITLRDKSQVKPYSIEELATSKVPHNIPYLEVYRTNEVMYRPYESPFLTQIDSTGSTGDSSGSGDSSGDGSGGSSGSVWTDISNIVWEFYPASKDKNRWIRSLKNAPNNWQGIANIVNKMGGNSEKQNKVIRKILNAKSSSGGSSASSQKSSKNRNAKLSAELKSIVKRYFKKQVNVTTMVNRYMSCKTNKSSIGAVTNHSSVWLKMSVNPGTVNDAVYRVKHKYS